MSGGKCLRVCMLVTRAMSLAIVRAKQLVSCAKSGCGNLGRRVACAFIRPGPSTHERTYLRMASCR